MYNHIMNVVTHYKGRVKGWDVVNEALGNDGKELCRITLMDTQDDASAIQAFIGMLPLFIIYPFLQKYFAEGITLGAVKG